MSFLSSRIEHARASGTVSQGSMRRWVNDAEKLEAENAQSTAKGLMLLAYYVVCEEHDRLSGLFTSWEKKKGLRIGEAPNRACLLLEHWARVFDRRADKLTKERDAALARAVK